MKLSRKVLTIIGCTFVFFLVVLSVFSEEVLIKRFTDIEIDSTKKILKESQDLLSKEISIIDDLNTDYSIWDDTYYYASNHNPEYIESNFSSLGTFQRFKIDFIILTDRSGKVLFSKEVSPYVKEGISLDPAFEREVLYYMKDLQRGTGSINGKGILLTNRAPILISAKPIMKNNKSGLANGALIFGRYLNSSAVFYVNQPLPSKPEIKLFAPKDLENLVSFDDQYGIHSINSKNIIGNVVIKDIFNKNALTLSFFIERTLYEKANSIIYFFLFFLLILCIFIAITMLYLIHKSIIKKIVIMNQTINTIGLTGNLSLRLIPQGKDEISELGDNFNKMLSRLNVSSEEIKALIFFDPLTGLPNRKRLFDMLVELVDIKKEKFALLFIDLDNFKIVNDSLGHPIGDKVLQEISIRLQAVHTDKNMVFRIGGDEFIIISDTIESDDSVKELAEEVLKSLNAVIHCNDNDFYISASIGITLYPNSGLDAASMMKNADTAMYSCKKDGGNGYRIYDKSMNDRSLNELELKRKMKEAISKEQFLVFYQPIYDVLHSQIVGAEALIRWKLDGKLVPPNDFLPLAKSSGMIVEIDNWVLKTACIQCKKWHNAGMKDFYISVNTSFKQLHQADFIEKVENALKDADLSPSFLNLEITEDESMEDVEFTIRTLWELKNLGVKVSLDDFGTGYSSLSYINKLPIDTLKIDKSMIEDLEHKSKNYTIVKAMIIMAHSLNIKVVVEGIEQDSQLSLLKDLHCDCIQGYLIGKPMEPKDFPM